MKRFIQLLAVLALILTGCQKKEASFKSVDVEEFATLMQDPNNQLLDVRTVAEYNEGHLPGCININVLDEANFPLVADSMLVKERPVLLYCRSGKRSKVAANILSKKGYQVIELFTGFNGWKESGKEIEK